MNGYESSLDSLLTSSSPDDDINWVKILEKYGTFLNSFHPDIKRLSGRVERPIYKIDRNEVSVQFNQPSLKEKMLPPTHIYLSIYLSI